MMGVGRGGAPSGGRGNSKSGYDFKGSSIMDIATKDPITTSGTTHVCDAVSLMVDRGIRRIPVVDPEDHSLEGILSARDLVGFFGGEGDYGRIMDSIGWEVCHEKDVPVSDIMTRDATHFLEGDKVGYAAGVMLKKGLGGCPVINEGGKVTAIVTEGDFMHKVADWGYDTTVGDLMSRNVLTLDSGQSVRDAVSVMVNGRRRLPVMDGGEVVGILRTRNILELFGRCCSEGREGAQVKDLLGTRVDGVMGKHFVSLRPHDKVEDIIEVVMALRRGGFPVEEDDKLVGIVTENDVFRMAYSK